MDTETLFEERMIDDDILAVVIRGGLDTTSTDEFDQRIRKHLDEGRSKIIIDCRYLGFLSSIGIGRLVMLQSRLRRRGGEVKLSSLQGPVAETIKVVGLRKLFDIYGDLEHARQSFRGTTPPDVVKRPGW